MLVQFHPQFRRKRRERNVQLKLITERTKVTEELKKHDKEELRETRFNDNIMKNMDLGFYILSDGLIILKANEKEQMGIYIQEKSTAELQKKIFENLWKESK